MKSKSQKIIHNLKGSLRHFPLLFSRHAWLMFTIVSLCMLVFGFLFVYNNAYSLSGQQYEAFTTTRGINDKNLEEALELIDKEQNSNVFIPTSNPFTP